MGMYTEFHYNADLNDDVPEGVLEVLRYMTGESPVEPDHPDHPLFKTDRWRSMLNGSSYYFAQRPASALHRDDLYGSDKPEYSINIRCDFKNYGREIQEFVDWIDPYVEGYPGDFLGFHRYESSETPTHIHKK